MLLQNYSGILAPLVSYTTRAPRDGVEDGNDYHFVTNEMLEHTGFGAATYGTAYRAFKDTDNKILAKVVDTQEADFSLDQSGLNVKVIFIMPPSGEELVRRLRKNGESEADANARAKKFWRGNVYLVSREAIGRTRACGCQRQRRIDCPGYLYEIGSVVVY